MKKYLILILAIVLLAGTVSAADDTNITKYLVAYYDFETGSGTTVVDRAYGRDGTAFNLNDGLWNNSHAKLGTYAMDSNGTNGHVTVPYDPAFAVDDAEGMTVFGWFYAQGDTGGLVSRYNDVAASEAGMAMYLDSSASPRITMSWFRTGFDTSTMNVDLLNGLNNWNFFMGCVKDGYQNMTINTTESGSDTHEIDFTVTTNFTMMRDRNTEESALHFHGLMDEIGYLNKSICDNGELVDYLYNSGSGREISFTDATVPDFSLIPYNYSTTNQSTYIGWLASEAVNYSMIHSVNADYSSGTTTINKSYSTFHNVSVTSLQNSTTYYVNTTIWDATGNINWTELSFTTATTAYTNAPIISGLTNSTTTNASVILSWNCDRGCNYTINFFNDSARAVLVRNLSDTTYATSPSSTINYLKNSTPYYVNLSVWDGYGNNREDNTFTFNTSESAIVIVTAPATPDPFMEGRYNLTKLTNQSTVWGLFSYANDSTSGILFGLFMTAIFFVMLFVLKRWDFDAALLSSSFVCFVLSSMLTYSKLLNFIYPLVFLMLTAFTAIYMFVAKRT